MSSPIPAAMVATPARRSAPRSAARWRLTAAPDELLFAGELPLHRPAGLARGEQAQIFGYHFLLAAKAAAHPLCEHVQVAGAQAEDMAELLPHDEWRLGAGADMQP